MRDRYTSRLPVAIDEPVARASRCPGERELSEAQTLRLFHAATRTDFAALNRSDHAESPRRARAMPHHQVMQGRLPTTSRLHVARLSATSGKASVTSASFTSVLQLPSSNSLRRACDNNSSEAKGEQNRHFRQVALPLKFAVVPKSKQGYAEFTVSVSTCLPNDYGQRALRL